MREFLSGTKKTNIWLGNRLIKNLKATTFHVIFLDSNIEIHLKINKININISAANAKGLEIKGTFARRSGKIFMDMQFTNRAMQNMSEFGIQLNSNSFGLQPEQV